MEKRGYRITHLGAENGVTGSCHLIQAEGLHIMVDCGLAQGDETLLPMNRWPVSPSRIDFLFVTHAHMDHMGRVPELLERGFQGEIICTHPTRELLVPMLQDGMRLSGKSGQERDRLGNLLDKVSWGFEYNETFQLGRGVTFKLGNAGHILGSCFVRFEGRQAGWSVVFSGDLGLPDTPILPDPDVPEPCDHLVLESTYGDRQHEGRKERIQRLGTTLSKSLSDRGKVFIPAFALGRMQELIYEMDRLFSHEGMGNRFPELHSKNRIPVFIDSPLGLKITDIYARCAGYWDGEARGLQESGDHPVDFQNLFSAATPREHARLLEMPGPAVIIAGSGMCTGGRIMSHLQKGLGDPSNDILFVGYQCPGTPGREILRSGKKHGGPVCLRGETIEVRAGIHHLPGYSAHADQNHLITWVKAMKKPPKSIKLVHGSGHARKTLARQLRAIGLAAKVMA